MILKILQEKLKKKHKESFSQSGEDLIIRFIFDSIGLSTPSYLDIGAHDPFYLSNSALFYKNGSVGVNIEPDPLLFKKIERSRRDDINLNIGISEIDGNKDFYIMNIPTLNTFSKNEAEKSSKEGPYSIKKTIPVPVRKLDGIINDYCNGSYPDFLSLDVEGLDEMIIKSIDFENSSPKVICVETISFSNNGLGVKDVKLIDYIESKGYLLYADTNINSIFVKKNLWINRSQ